MESVSLDLSGSRKKSLLEIAGVIESAKRLDVSFEQLEYILKVSPGSQGKSQRLIPSFKSNKVDKYILNGCSGLFRSGRATAVMGASGAGKTSLLNVLASECDVGVVGGTIKVNGVTCYGSEMKRFCGFVFQDDVLSPTMTVREAINMSATLRLPKDTDPKLKEQRVNSIIHLLELTRCADTLIGDESVKGISGGERKRCAVAMELVINPAVLYLDEPTTGLDSYTAFSVVATLKRVARLRKTVVATIHQPSSELFHLFDDVLLLASGQVMYYGPVKGAMRHFNSLGYPCPKYTNPADFIFMAVLTNESGKSRNPYKQLLASEEPNEARIKRLLGLWSTSDGNESVKRHIQQLNEHPGGVPTESLKQSADIKTQFSYLLHRYSLDTRRKPMIMVAKILQAIISGVIIGLLFLNTDDKTGTVAVQNRVAGIFIMVLNNVFNCAFGILPIFSLDKEIFRREYGAGYYRLLPFFVAKILTKLPGFLAMPIVQTPIIYWMMGLQNNAGKYFIAWAITILSAFNGFSFGVAVACTFQLFQVALVIMPLILLTLMLFSGFFVNQDTIPGFVRWIKYLSPMRYAYEGLIKNEFDGLTIELSPGNYLTGQQQIENLGFANDHISIGACCAILASMSLAFLLYAYYMLYRLTDGKSKKLSYRDMSKKHR